MSQKHIVIFSHGFGQKKDARGLFTDISSALNEIGIESVLFDYNTINDSDNTVTVPSLLEQAEILNDVVKKTIEANPNSIIDIIGCSQGPLVVGLAKPLGIRKAIFIGPSLKPDAESMAKRFGAREGSVVDMNGVSKFVRRDNSLTIVPAEYWQSLNGVDGIALYNSLSEIMDVTMIRANQDEVLSSTDITGISPRVNVINLDGNHDFTNEYRSALIDVIKNSLK